MKHEFLNGDALEEIIIDDSVNLFILHPPYMGIDTQRYANPEKQINAAKDQKAFVKKLSKITQNCEKALKKHGSIIMILPVDNWTLMSEYLHTVKKKTDLTINPTMIWSVWDEKYANKNTIDVLYCHVIHLSKGPYRHDKEFIEKYNNPVFTLSMKPDELVEDYGSMGFVEDAMPVELAERFISMFSRSGDTVADVLGGTGTVSIAAENLGRDSIYNDASFIQVKIAKKRMDDLIDQKKRQKK
jgi:DNA modification methylase